MLILLQNEPYNCSIACAYIKLIISSTRFRISQGTTIHEIGHVASRSSQMFGWQTEWSTIYNESGGTSVDFNWGYPSYFHPNPGEDIAIFMEVWALDSEALLQQAIDLALEGKPVLFKKILYWDLKNPIHFSNQFEMLKIVPSTSPDLGSIEIINKSYIPIRRSQNGKIRRITLNNSEYFLHSY